MGELRKEENWGMDWGWEIGKWRKGNRVGI
jgi:hypothetical protein